MLSTNSGIFHRLIGASPKKMERITATVVELNSIPKLRRVVTMDVAMP